LDGLPNFIDERSDVEDLQFELHLPGFDFGDVEDIVDEHEQVFAGFVDAFEICRVGGSFFRAGEQLEQFAIANDGVEGRPQLMAHVGEKLALDLIGGKGLFVGMREILVDSPNFGFHALTLPNLQLQRIIRERQLASRSAISLASLLPRTQ